VIDLDHNATTRPSPAVAAAVARGLTELWHNPSSVHRGGQAARHAVELARASLAALIGANARDITLTSGGTEAIHLAIRGTLAALPPGGRPVVAAVVTEHAAVRELLADLARSGAVEPVPIAVDARGVIDRGSLAAACARSPALVVAQWANNETGVVQAVEAVSAAARAAGARFLCDATQWVGKAPVPSLEPFDLLAFAPHKFHGPKGVGVLWARRGVRLRPEHPGSQELGRRGGTENVPGILGAGVAAEEARAWLADPAARTRQEGLRDRFEALVTSALPEAVVVGGGGPRLWNTSNLAFPRIEAEALLLALSERGVAASAGAACSSGSLEPSPVLLAMGLRPEVAHGAVRFSLSRDTSAAQVEEAAGIVIAAARSLWAGFEGMAPPLGEAPPAGP
jgi:cysteine desulfurase